jgi:hypothetical protein
MVQVKSGTSRASHQDKELLKLWGAAFHGRVELWKFKKGKPLERELIYDENV